LASLELRAGADEGESQDASNSSRSSVILATAFSRHPAEGHPQVPIIAD
jgi:hypothetical protein